MFLVLWLIAMILSKYVCFAWNIHFDGYNIVTMIVIILTKCDDCYDVLGDCCDINCNGYDFDEMWWLLF